MKRNGRSKVLIGFLLVPLSTAPALGDTAAAQKFSDTTQVTVVEVPVQVVRDGEPVRGLTAADFVVTEGKQQRPITGFDVFDLAAPQNQMLSAAIPAAGRRHFLLLFDLSNSDPKSIGRAQLAVRDSLLKTLTPSDLVAVATYSTVNGLQLLLGFTTDIRQILRAVGSLGLGQVAKGAYTSDVLEGVSELARAQRGLEDAQSSLATGDKPTTNGDNAVQRAMAPIRLEIAQHELTQFQALVSQLQAELVEEQRKDLAQQKNVVAGLSRAFYDFARMMEGISGRKLVIYFSEGFDTTIVTGSEDSEDQAAMADASMNGGFVGVDTQERFGSAREGSQLTKMLEELRRADCVVESIDIAGLRGQNLDDDVATRPRGEASLAQLARDTGGDLYRNFNDFGEALDRIVKRSNVTYVLSFQPVGLAADGSYHHIKVQLKNAPRGTQITYRTGYFAPRPYNQQRPVERMLAVADQLAGTADAGSIATAVLAEPFRAAGAKAYVPVVIEADGAALLAGNAGKTLPAEIYVRAVDANGLIQDFFDQKLALDLDKVGPALRLGGLKFVGHLELPPGDYSVRALLRNGATGAFGKRAVVVSVPAFGPLKAVFLPPLFPELPARWTVVRESPRGEQRDAPYPFTVGQQVYVPASLPRLKPGQAAAVALVGYNLGSGLKTEARVQSADGRDVGSCPFRLGGLEAGGDTRADVYKASFRPPENLAPGNYRLVVTVTGPAGPQTLASPFAIAPAIAPPG